MRLPKPHLISSLFFLMCLISCAFRTQEDTGKIIINLPSPARSASAPDNVDSYIVEFFLIPEKYSTVAPIYFLGENPNNINIQENSTLEELVKLVAEKHDEVFIIDNIAPTSIYSKSVEPGEWLVYIFALDKNKNRIYSGGDIVNTTGGKNVVANIKMRKRSNDSSNSKYTFDSGGNAYSCSYSNITMTKNNFSSNMSKLQEGLGGTFRFSETEIPEGITITNIIIDNSNFFIENFGCSGDNYVRNLLEEAYAKVKNLNLTKTSFHNLMIHFI